MDKKLLINWVNAGQFHAPNGWKSSGIEHRIMREAGLVENVKSRDPDGVGETMVKCADIVAIRYPDEVRALYEYARSGFKVSAVKTLLKCETRAAHRLIERGECLMDSAFLVMLSMTYVNTYSR